MPSAQTYYYRPLQQQQQQCQLVAGGSKSRRKTLLLCLLICLPFLYLAWCALANSLDDAADDAASTSFVVDANNNAAAANVEEQSTLCSEDLIDKRAYMQNRPRSDYDHLPMIYFVTPTYPRREQVPELTRLAQTLMHVPRLHWILANDDADCNVFLDYLLAQYGIPITHLSSPMPSMFRSLRILPRGVANRRAALRYLREHNITDGVLYFGDDDNTYDLKLFTEIRNTQRVSMFPVGLIAEYSVSGPVVHKGKVVGFLDSWMAGRHWPIDMAGFAVNMAYVAAHPKANMPYKPGYEEDYFLRSLSLQLNNVEPMGKNCTEILVWHTQTKRLNRTVVRFDHEYLDDRLNLGALFKTLKAMGVAYASENEGVQAKISYKNRQKTLGGLLS